MPHVSGDPTDTEARPAGRIRGTKRLLTTAAVMMSVFLVTSSFVTTLLIRPAEFEAGGRANGRALAFLAHEYLGNAFGTTYDASTIAILWFAGASAMAGMLNLIPRYLPRYGMSPEWAGAVRPLVLILTGTAFLITWIFDASVDGQGGAYATGVLVLFTSAGVAVTLAARRAGQRKRMVGFAVISTVFAYTTVSNVIERPDGVKIGACFVLAIVSVSIASRIKRVFELRATEIDFDATSQVFLRDCARRTIRLVAHQTEDRDVEEYVEKVRQLRRDHDLPDRPGRDLRRGDGGGPERLRGPAAGAWRGAAPALPGDERDRLVGTQRGGRPGAPDPRRHRRDPPHLLRVDRGQPGPAAAALPAVRAPARSRRSPARCCAGPSATRHGVRTCTWVTDRA